MARTRNPVPGPMAGRKIAKLGGTLSGGGSAARVSHLPNAPLPKAGHPHPLVQVSKIKASVYKPRNIG